ncbi:MAG: fimbrillin family protein [Clostridium sp.]|nr:fimbrillin family protein [Bacteroides sp.]MCM1197688.1 fimbrillin family protein [Clostridium sp.]
MKKNLFFLAAATVLLASCSNEEVIELNKGNAIDFRAAMGVASRGAETTTANIGQFLVTAIDGNDNYFTDELFTNENGGTIFKSASEYFWPGTHTLTFYAYSYYTGMDSNSKLNAIEKSKLGTIDITATGQTLTGFSPASKVADQIDFVSATTTATKDQAANGVALAFNHNLVQAQVKAKTTNKTYTFEVKGIKFGNIVSTGDFNFANSTWTLDDSKKADYEIEYASAFALNPEATEAEDLSDLSTVQHMMVLPQKTDAGNMTEGKENVNKGAYIAVLLKITTTNANKTQVYPYAGSENAYDWAYVPVDIEWKAGNRYVYTLDFSRGAGYDENGDPILGDPISFTASVENWNDHINTLPDTDMNVHKVDKPGTNE